MTENVGHLSVMNGKASGRRDCWSLCPVVPTSVSCDEPVE